MRSGSKRLLIGLGSCVIAAAMVAPSFAGKKAVSDEELDLVTAAGQPVLVNAGGNATVSFTATTTIASDIQSDSQTDLRALILNNVVGENQVHNGINISAAGGNSETSSQTNTITQSWGSVLDFDVIATDGADATASKSCDALICKGSVTAKGGDASVALLSKAADVIIHSDEDLTVTYNPVTAIASDIGDNAQGNLIALVVNNVTGLNQVATGINIQSGGVTTAGGPPTELTVGAFGGGTASQANNINQFRGTPAGFRP